MTASELVRLGLLGVVVTLLVIFLERYSRRGEDANGVHRGPCVRHRRFALALPPSAVHAVVMDALTVLDARLVLPLRSDRICAEYSGGRRSRGEMLSVWLTPMPTGTAVLVESRPVSSAVMVDFGSNRRLADRLASMIASAGPVVPLPVDAPTPQDRVE
jgi:hypothetical protein